ncbi:MAG: D-cysteine desulfhydrase family protein [Ignavibacteriales bacterium]|nr:D-cysteine desulfhydrase family protein [Ignavibacteriales bacterium]
MHTAISMLSRIPKISLAHLPTPLEEAPRMAEKIGVSKLYIKRDDLTGLACGGNKARKLEYDFGEIVNGGYDVVITAGGIQSNHARMTAAACRKLGLDIKLVLGGPDFTLLKGNLLLDGLFGAEIRYLIDDDANDSLTVAMKKWAVELSARGRKPYIIPIGGSTGLGALGYVQAMQEIAEQFGNGNVQIIVGVGSCGTFAGSLLGTKMFMPQSRVIGISVSRTAPAIAVRTGELIREEEELLQYHSGVNAIAIECYDEYFTEYGVMTQAGKQAIDDCALLEGILLDPIYTGKVMAGLTGLVQTKRIDPAVPVIFIHTGGTPIIFSFEEDLGKSVNITKIKTGL